MIICGFDPGFKGGIAVFDADKPVHVCIMPIIIQKNDKKRIDVKSVVKILKDFKVEHILIEQVHAFPGQGGVGNFSFGQNFGTLLGIFETLDIPFEEVSPMRWKKLVLGEGYTEGKNQGVEFCKQKYPDINLLPTKRSKNPHDGMSDAMCIASYYLIRSNINKEKERNLK